MFIDLRYHVVSIVAVFLALGLGVVIGVGLGKTANLQVEKQLRQLETTYQKIRDDQKLLQASLQTKDQEIEYNNQFLRAVMPNLIGSRLLGRRIAIIRTNDSVDMKYAKQLFAFLRQAGAEVTSITSFVKVPNLSDAAAKTEMMNAFNITNPDEKTVTASLYTRVIDALVQGQNSSQLAYLQNKEMIQLWGDYNRGYVDTIIFFGGGLTPESNHQKNVDLYLLDGAQKKGIRTVGVETTFVTESYMRLYQTKCQGTVDNVDTLSGEASLVYLLASGRKGYYGIKDTARSVAPDFKFSY